MALYRRIVDRVSAGENYYAAAMDEQRTSNYPTKPFVTVRLPTLALMHRWLGEEGVRFILITLWVFVCIAVMQQARGHTSRPEWVSAAVFTMLGGAAVIIPAAPVIHELLSGLLLSLAFGIYRPGKWWPALVVAGLALAVRELAAPFILLWFVFALVERRMGEAMAVLGLLVLFSLGLILHQQGVSAHAVPGDLPSQGWSALAGFGLPLAALSKLTALLLLPLWLAAPLAILPLLGWLGLGGRLGLFGFLWFVGFLTAMALFARPENFYWVQMLLPAYLAGFAFVPRAIGDLWHATSGTKSKQS